MGLVDFVVLATVIAIVAVAGWYIYKEKKNGKKCIGCPDSSACSGNCSGCKHNCGEQK